MSEIADEDLIKLALDSGEPAAIAPLVASELGNELAWAAFKRMAESFSLGGFQFITAEATETQPRRLGWYFRVQYPDGSWGDEYGNTMQFPWEVKRHESEEGK